MEKEFKRFGIGDRRFSAVNPAFEVIIVFALDLRRALDLNYHNMVDLDKARVKGAGSVINFGFSKIINMVNF
ncbi:hypothetical protein [Cohnella kolymensis]|uniref:hypothetical protein n=1 Tax=Cohnella kolymensis TaxID=1590652 RepID=UPI001269E9F9|nr:hypothetical protein [Cohnella kolymensis]